MIVLKRAYDPPSDEDGERILVDRLWPRGLAKDEARLSSWLKEIAPSPELRKWYGHDPSRWGEFRRRYETELRSPEKRALVEGLAGKSRRGVVTLVYGARDRERNHAVVLKDRIGGIGT